MEPSISKFLTFKQARTRLVAWAKLVGRWALHPPIGVLIVVLAMLVFAGLENQYRNSSRADYTAAQEYEESERVIPFGAPPQGPYTEPETNRDEWRAERDLEAQEQMALWAFWLWLATIVGIGLIAATLWETRKGAYAALEMAKEAKESTKAAALTAEEARIANQLASDRAERQFDPYLFVSEAKYVSPPDDLPEGWSTEGEWIRIVVKNGGNWTAFVKETAQHTFRFASGKHAGGGGSAGSGGTREIKPGETISFRFGGSYAPPKVEEDLQVFVGIRIEYDTLEGRRRTRDFWFRNPNPGGAPDQWRLEEIGRPDLIDALPDMLRGPLRERKGIPTRQDFEEIARYHQGQ